MTYLIDLQTIEKVQEKDSETMVTVVTKSACMGSGIISIDAAFEHLADVCYCSSAVRCSLDSYIDSYRFQWGDETLVCIKEICESMLLLEIVRGVDRYFEVITYMTYHDFLESSPFKEIVTGIEQLSGYREYDKL